MGRRLRLQAESVASLGRVCIYVMNTVHSTLQMQGSKGVKVGSWIRRVDELAYCDEPASKLSILTAG